MDSDNLPLFWGSRGPMHQSNRPGSQGLSPLFWSFWRVPADIRQHSRITQEASSRKEETRIFPCYGLPATKKGIVKTLGFKCGDIGWKDARWTRLMHGNGGDNEFRGVYGCTQQYKYLSIVSQWYLFNTRSNLLSFPLIYLLSCGVNPNLLFRNTNNKVIPILYKSCRAGFCHWWRRLWPRLWKKGCTLYYR